MGSPKITFNLFQEKKKKKIKESSHERKNISHPVRKQLEKGGVLSDHLADTNDFTLLGSSNYLV